MPRYVAQGTDAATLVGLVDAVPANEEFVQAVEAGDSWVVITRRKPGRPPKTPQERA